VTDLIERTSVSIHSEPHVCPFCKCVVPRHEAVIPQLGIRRWVQPRCGCEVKAFEGEIQEAQSRLTNDKTRELFAVSNLGERFKETRFENFVMRTGAEKAFEQAKGYAAEFERWKESSLFLYGDPGNGKSFLAAAVANSLMERGRIVVFTTVADLLTRIRETFRQKGSKETEGQILNAVARCDLLILDDIGAEKASDWVAEELFKIIDGRYRDKKPIFYTSNLNPLALQGRFDPLQGNRIADRVLEMAVPVENKASSYRRETAIKRAETMKREGI